MPTPYFKRDNEPLAVSTEKMVPQELSQGKDCPSLWRATNVWVMTEAMSLGEAKYL